MSGANSGGPVRPGATWSDPDGREAFFPGAGSIEWRPWPCDKPKGIRPGQTWELPETDPAELALAKLSPFDQQELLPDPIPLSERQPGVLDILKAGPCSLAWLGRELPGGALALGADRPLLRAGPYPLAPRQRPIPAGEGGAVSVSYFDGESVSCFDGEEVIRRIEELMDFDESLNLKPKKIIIGKAAHNAIRSFARQHLFSDRTLLSEVCTICGLPVTTLPIGADPWRVDVQSVGVEVDQ